MCRADKDFWVHDFRDHLLGFSPQNEALEEEGCYWPIVILVSIFSVEIICLLLPRFPTDEGLYQVQLRLVKVKHYACSTVHICKSPMLTGKTSTNITIPLAKIRVKRFVDKNTSR